MVTVGCFGSLAAVSTPAGLLTIRCSSAPPARGEPSRVTSSGSTASPGSRAAAPRTALLTGPTFLEYDLALGCFMEGQYQLALEWLDRSDADMPVYVSKDLRSKIKERMK